MSCQSCESERIASITAKCDDRCSVSIGENDHNDYAPHGMGIGGGDYVEFSWCLCCGQIQGKFPKETTELEGNDEETSDDD